MKNRREKSWIKRGLLFLLLITALVWVKPADTDAATSLSQIKSCTINGSGKKVVVKAKVTKKTKAMGKKLYLVAYDANEKVGATTKRKPLASVKAKKGTVTFQTPLNRGKNNSRLFSKFAVAYKSGKKYKIISNTRYITNPEKIAGYKGKYPKTYSKKGLQVENYGDAVDLGVQHTVINITLNSIIADKGTGDAYRYKGTTYYFNGPMLSYYDQIVSDYNRMGSSVTAILLLRNAEDSRLNPLRFRGSDQAFYSSINTGSKKACREFEAIMTYLASRYGQKSHLISGWILGNELGNTKEWNYAGGKSLSSYMDSYVRAFRICHTAVKSVNKHAHVYLSLDYFWNRDLDDGGTAYFSDKAILNKFYQKLKAEGLTDWYIAYHAYSQGLIIPEFWDDGLAANSEDAAIVNFNNLSVLTNYVKKHFGKNVKIMLSEQSFNSCHGQLTQAAAYAYAYYISESNSMIEAFIYGRHIDNPGEIDPSTHTTIAWGLRETTYTKRLIWDVFQYIDSPDGLHLTNRLLPYINTIHSWKQVPGYQQAKYKKMPSKRGKVKGIHTEMVGYNRVLLTWKASAYADGYEIYRATSKNGKYKRVSCIPSRVHTLYYDTDVKAGKTYYYKIRTYRSFTIASTLNGSFSSKVKVTVTVGPTTLTKAEGKVNAVLLKWKKSEGASGYDIYRATSKKGKYSKIKRISKGSTLTYTDTKAKTGKTYYYKVKAYVKKSGKEYKAKDSNILHAIPVPERVTINTVTAGRGRLELAWNKVTPATGYELYWCNTNNGEFVRYKKITDAKTISYRKSFAAGSEYYLKVRAYLTVGKETVYGSYSRVVSATPYTDAVSVKKAVRNKDDSVTLNFQLVSEASGYQIYRSTSENGTYVQVGRNIAESGLSEYIFEDTTAPKAVSYYKIRIYEKNSFGKTIYGEWSSVKKAEAARGDQSDTGSIDEPETETETEKIDKTEIETESEKMDKPEIETESEKTDKPEIETESEKIDKPELETESEKIDKPEIETESEMELETEKIYL